MGNFVIADLKLFDNEQREKMGYSNFKIMNEEIIKNWNKTVKKEDKVIVMGDIGQGTLAQMKDFFSSLNGEICYISNDSAKKFTQKEWKDVGFKFIWSVSLFKELDSGEIILFCIEPIKYTEIYEKYYKLIITDNTNPIDGMINGIMLSADAKKWGYSPIDTDNLLEIYQNMKEFEEMQNSERRSDIKEDK